MHLMKVMNNDAGELALIYPRRHKPARVYVLYVCVCVYVLNLRSFADLNWQMDRCTLAAWTQVAPT